jgi:hypothetical protein
MDVPAGTPRCPECGSSALPLAGGRMASAAIQAARDGRVAVTGSCIVDPDRDPNWQCTGPSKHRWRDGGGTDARWTAAWKRGLRGYPHCPRCGGESITHVYPGAEEFWEHELASGLAELAREPGPPGTNWQHRCLGCDVVFTAR